jgi:hypothetical protein
MTAMEPLDCGCMVLPECYQEVVKNLIESDLGLLRRKRKRRMGGLVRALVYEPAQVTPIPVYSRLVVYALAFSRCWYVMYNAYIIFILVY